MKLKNEVVKSITIVLNKCWQHACVPCDWMLADAANALSKGRKNTHWLTYEYLHVKLSTNPENDNEKMFNELPWKQLMKRIPTAWLQTWGCACHFSNITNTYFSAHDDWMIHTVSKCFLSFILWCKVCHRQWIDFGMGLGMGYIY